MAGSADGGPRREPSSRRAAVGGAILASAAIVAAAAARGHLDGWLLAAALLGVAASALALGERRDRTPRIPGRHGDLPQAGLADAVLANIPDPVILVDRRVVVLEANEAARTLLPALRARHPLSFALRSPDVLAGIDEVLRTGEPLRIEHSERVPTERTFEVQIGPLKVAAEAAEDRTGVVLFFRDLTSARRIENMRVDFVANASHELRTPLASLLGFIETLQGPARNDAAARERFLEIRRGQAQRMTRLIDDLLSLSRIEMRAHLAPETRVDLTALAAHLVDTLSPLARERSLVVSLTASDGPLWVLGDRDELLRVIENLLENATKYGESGGRIDVSVERRSGAARAEVELRVRDHGPGIAPEHLPRLTERFYRVDVAESRQKGGTGLGLAIVKHIVARHRGQLMIESEPGDGAVFRVLLPEATEIRT
jgi:two-component system phosphate regulon sensor histidine kinase PhoR